MGSRKTKTAKKKSVALVKDLTNDELLKALETIARAINVQVRFEKGDFKSGYCTIEKQNLVVIQKRDTLDKQLCVLAGFLGTFDLSQLYIAPALKEFIEQCHKEYAEQVRYKEE